jgi:hypothetical protein
VCHFPSVSAPIPVAVTVLLSVPAIFSFAVLPSVALTISDAVIILISISRGVVGIRFGVDKCASLGIGVV